jgi:hypothetical protein
MDQLARYRQIVQDILVEQAAYPFSHGNIDLETIFDEKNDRYTVMMVGWNRDDRFYGPLAHIDIVDGKLWIQRDGTAESLPLLLMEKGVPKDRIVMAYRHPREQELMGFAMA